MKMLKRVSLLVLLSILVVTCSLDAGAFLYTPETDTIENPRQFTADEHDTGAAAYYLGVRYYDPHAGRFISRDPLGDGLNWYIYAFNNPLAFIDPSGLRPVNAIERAALLYTFGETMGNFLAFIIDVELDPNVAGGAVRSSNPTQVLLNPGYATEGANGQNLGWLSKFVHEATHVWQRQTGRHRHGKAGEDYVYTNNQLLQNDLKKEEHANAVDTWFYVHFGLKNNQIVATPTGAHQVGYKSAWVTVLRSLGWDDPAINSIDFSGDYWQSAANLQSHVDFFYKNVVTEVQGKNMLGLEFPIAY